MAGFTWGVWERPTPDQVRTLAARRTLRWWVRVRPVGPWLFVPVPGFGANMTWGTVVPLTVVAEGARVEEPQEVRLARAWLAHIERTHPQ